MDAPSSTALSPAPQSPTPPHACPRCRTRAGDWCCWELLELERRIVELKHSVDKLATFFRRSEGAIREAARRYGMPKPDAPPADRKKCPSCDRHFVPTEVAQLACNDCRAPAPISVAA